ncbi:uncharacterized protein MELLADRAFT_111801 [Melampsora larici-populina 98AG31]|uniref:Uncharacterized protein n=1 Tax=Melampsora larici-populina (strain 98AG31 / pathotype 3-4-7) TaxID=747676 RepID=F4S4E4_MELLP|nr:uncharacterized protein MELLADRAFT_111801 [Melampsora larici-populina 98AG31]EGG00483.1 hypothetical protein MELLADRAFT_111801 [Melampsora larici-populina 98AG31]
MPTIQDPWPIEYGVCVDMSKTRNITEPILVDQRSLFSCSCELIKLCPESLTSIILINQFCVPHNMLKKLVFIALLGALPITSGSLISKSTSEVNDKQVEKTSGACGNNLWHVTRYVEDLRTNASGKIGAVICGIDKKIVKIELD